MNSRKLHRLRNHQSAKRAPARMVRLAQIVGRRAMQRIDEDITAALLGGAHAGTFSNVTESGSELTIETLNEMIASIPKMPALRGWPRADPLFEDMIKRVEHVPYKQPSKAMVALLDSMLLASVPIVRRTYPRCANCGRAHADHYPINQRYACSAYRMS